MSIRFFTVMMLLLLAGCSTATPIPVQSTPVNTLSATAIATHNVVTVVSPIPTNTWQPFPTPIPSITPVISITLQPGFDVWEAGSLDKVYAVQYPTEKWFEDGTGLKHKSIAHCSINLHGGSDICMSGGCTSSSITLGLARFEKTSVGNNLAIYSSYENAVRAHISYQIFGDEDSGTCRRDGEEVLNTLIFRPERDCIDRAAFVGDITIPDNTVIPAGTNFVKTWRLKNVGTCTWNQGYILNVYGKSSGTEADWVNLPERVPPGQTTDISIELPAPTVEGPARWEAAIQNDLGDLFGLGAEPYPYMTGKPFWVQIQVVPARN